MKYRTIVTTYVVRDYETFWINPMYFWFVWLFCYRSDFFNTKTKTIKAPSSQLGSIAKKNPADAAEVITSKLSITVLHKRHNNHTRQHKVSLLQYSGIQVETDSRNVENTSVLRLKKDKVLELLNKLPQRTRFHWAGSHLHLRLLHTFHVCICIWMETLIRREAARPTKHLSVVPVHQRRRIQTSLQHVANVFVCAPARISARGMINCRLLQAFEQTSVLPWLPAEARLK